MEVNIVLAYDSVDEVCRLFSEYTDMLINGDPEFREYLEIQNYDEELNHLDTKYGLPGGRLYLAYCDGRAAGCIGLKKLDSLNCEMKRLYVRPEFRGMRIGGMLIQRIIDDAKEIGYKHMLLDTLPFLESAVHMYKKWGFYEIPSYNDSPMESSIYMRLDLDGDAMNSDRSGSADKAQPQVLSVNGKDYSILKLLGRGKGGYSYLAERDGRRMVLKQIHHEPCAYYQFGNKIEAEIRDYDRLQRIGILLPKMLDVDKDNERIIKEYIDGDTVYEMVLEDRLPATCLEQVRAMCGPLYAANINIDYFPTNFILQDGALYYVDYECNEYMEEWNFENWGVKYWSKTPEFLKYAEEHLHISNLKNWPRLSGRAAQWFHEKWQIPLEEYRSSIEASISGGTPVPQWYVAVKGERIIGGLGVIENDFHRRKDLTPNVCALYVEEECRGQGIAGKLLDHVCRDMLEKGIDTLYLITDHTSFYERYGWEFLCLVEEEEGGLCRMYVHREYGRK